MRKRQPPGGLVTAVYARSLLDYLRSRGIDPARLYAPERIAELESPTARAQVPLAEWVSMFEAAAATTGEPDLALKAGATVKTKHLGALGYVLMSCATFADVIAQLTRYIRLLGEIGHPRLEIRDRHAHLIWTWPYATSPPPALAQFMQATRVTFSRWLINRPDLKVDAHFHFSRPADTTAYAGLFGGRLYFDQPESKLVFPVSYLELPIISADAESRQRAEAEAQSVLKDISGDTECLRQLKIVLTQGLGVGRVSLEHAADTLGISTRTLQRRLDEHRHSFRQVLDDVRKARAQSYLRTTNASLAEIAFLLGYTEQSTFQNAFKRWAGLSPGAYRSRFPRKRL